MDKDKVICPGCGWTGDIEDLRASGDCPECLYENGVEPYRLLTIREMLQNDMEYGDVRMDLFLASLFRLLE